MLGDRTHTKDIAALYTQDYNARIKKDTHYVLSFLLGKPWPSYTPTDSDLARLTEPQP